MANKIHSVHPEVSDAELDSLFELPLSYTFTFGKHKGEDLEDVIEDDPSYIACLVDNDIRQLDASVTRIIKMKRII